MKHTQITYGPWPWPRPRVVIEQADTAAADAKAEALRRAGYAVAVCAGPTVHGRIEEECPLAGFDEGCTIVDGADAVVWSLGLDRDEGRGVLAGLLTRRPSTPLVVELPADQAERYRDSLPACEILAAPAMPDDVVAAVQRAVAAAAA